MKLKIVKQLNNSDTGNACLASIFNHFGLNMPIDKVRKLSNTTKNEKTKLQLISTAEKIGLTAKEFKINLDILTSVPLPAIVELNQIEGRLPYYAVLCKVSKKKITLMNPLYGKMENYSFKDFKGFSTGTILLFSKEQYLKFDIPKVKPIRRLWSILKPHKTILFHALFGAVTFTILGLAMAIYVQKITDFVLVGGNTNLLNLMSIAMIIIVLLQGYIGSYKSIIVAKTGQLVDAQLILSYYQHLLKLPQSFFNTTQIGDIITRIHDAVKIRIFVVDVSIEMFVNIFIVVFSFILMFTYYWKLALIMFFIVPFYIFLYLLIDYFNKKVERRSIENYADFNSQIVESLGHIKIIRQFGVEHFFNSITENRFVKFLFTFYKSQLNNIFSETATLVLASLFAIILLWVGSTYVLDGSITTGELFSFYALLAYFNAPVKALINMNKTIQNALVATDRLFKIMDLEIEKNENKVNLRKENLGDILFENVTFGYERDTKIFKNFNVRLPLNKITAIVGESGSGKTTLISMIQKFYPIDDGKIKIGDFELKHLDSRSLRKIIGVIPQETNLFSGNIIENIALGDNEPDMERIVNLSNQLGISSFVDKLQNGFETQIGENGAKLSGGQRQRVCIARALYKNPEILLLDEATSALDTPSENLVKDVINDFNTQKKTVIIIAHRLSTISNADVILVMKSGKIIEKGNHKDLLKRKGEYSNLWGMQNGEINKLNH
ncbi:MAG: peptidase domain-containing ABC transporter [Bacteroidota bacterium]